MRYILVGDILGQFGSPCNYYHDTEITDSQLSQSGLLKSLSGGNTVRLSECRRSCKQLFDIYQNPPPISILRQMFPYSGLSRWNICLSNRCRKAINQELNKGKQEGLHICLEKDPSVVQSQDIYLAVGCPIVCCKTGLGVTNGEFLTSTSITPITLESEEGKIIEVPPEKVQTFFRLSHARVCQQVQGRTLIGKICVLETSHPRWTVKHTGVSLSRAQGPQYLSVC